jgi:carboxyl-terminal processing protease
MTADRSGDGNEDAIPTTESQPAVKKPGVSIDEQLNKALDLLKSKAA